MGACTSSAAAGAAAAGAPGKPPPSAAVAAPPRRAQLDARALEDAGLGPAYPVTGGSVDDADAWGGASGGRDLSNPRSAPHDGPALAVAVVQALPHVAGTRVVDAIAHRGTHAADDGTFRSVAAVMLQLFAGERGAPGGGVAGSGGGGGAGGGGLDDAAVAAMLRAFAAAALRRPGEPHDYSGAEVAAAVAQLRAQLDACVRQRTGDRPPGGGAGGGGVTADDLETWLEKLDEESGDPAVVVVG